jgi:hypothetical protein
VFEVVKNFSLLAAVQDTKAIGAIESLQKAVDKLTTKIDSEPRPTPQEAPTYASVAKGGRLTGGPATTRLDISQKVVPARHTEDARTRAVWLQDTRWLQVLGGGAGEEKGVRPHSAWNPSKPDTRPTRSD